MSMTTFNGQVLQLSGTHSIIYVRCDGSHDSTCYITEKLWMSSVAKDNTAHRSRVLGPGHVSQTNK